MQMDRGDLLFIGACLVIALAGHIAFRRAKNQDRRTAERMLRHADFEGSGLFI